MTRVAAWSREAAWMEFYVFCVTFRNALFRVGTFYAFYIVAPAAAFAATGAKVGIE